MRICRDIFNHQGTRVTAIEESACTIGDYDLTGEGFRERYAARALIVVLDADGRIQPSYAASAQTCGSAAFLNRLPDERAHCRGRKSAHFKDGSVCCNHSRDHLGIAGVDICTRQTAGARE